MESAMKSISLGCNSFFSMLNSFIKSSSMCKRPAVSTRITSLAESFASLMAPLTISSGLSVPAPGQIAVPTAFATCASCSRADIGQKFIGNADVNVTFQQRLANFRKRRVQVLVREFTLSPQVLERALQLICQILKHVLK